MKRNGKKGSGIWSSKVLARLALTVAPLPKNTLCSIDVTNKCNLRCAHCYFFSYDQKNQPELSVDEWLEKIEQMQSRRHQFFSCTWVGGEPLLRQDLVEKGRRFFKSNKVVTNGTIPLPTWEDVEFHVSIDGTKEIHDEIRGSGCYDRIKKNLSATDRHGIALACCINRKNLNCVEELIREWKDVANIKHILFDFLTPVGKSGDNLWLTFAERDRMIDTLESLKIKYGDFVGAPAGTFDLMREKNRHKAIGANCIFIKHGTAFDASGNVKKPCVIGPNADCNRCGCIVPFSVRAWKKPANLLREAWHEITVQKTV